MLANVIVLFRVSSHGYLGVTARALEVETKNLDTEVIDILTSLFSHIELGTNIQEVTAGIAPDTHRQHHSDIVLFVPRPMGFFKLRRVKIRWKVFYQNFAFGHLNIIGYLYLHIVNNFH